MTKNRIQIATSISGSVYSELRTPLSVVRRVNALSAARSSHCSWCRGSREGRGADCSAEGELKGLRRSERMSLPEQ